MSISKVVRRPTPINNYETASELCNFDKSANANVNSNGMVLSSLL